jgi:integrase
MDESGKLPQSQGTSLGKSDTGRAREPRRAKLTERMIAAARHSGTSYAGADGRLVYRREILWDSEQPGLGLRLLPSGRKVFILRWQERGKNRIATLERWGKITLDSARDAAKVRFGKATLTGAPPIVRHTRRLTVAALAERFQKEKIDRREKALTRLSYTLALARVVDGLGSIESDRVEGLALRRFLDGIEADFGKDPRNLVRHVFRQLWRYGIAEGEIPPTTPDPLFGLGKATRTRQRGRTLRGEEIAALGRALEEDAVHWHDASDDDARTIIRLLALTGARRTEIAHLCWKDVDLEARVIRLGVAKSGPRGIALGPAAVAILAQRERPEGGNARVFPDRPGRAVNGRLWRVWERVRLAAGLDGMRLHDLRHSFVTRGVEAGGAVALIGRAVGHADTRTTEGYVQIGSQSQSVRDVAERASEDTAAALAGREPAEVLPMHKWRK